MTTLYVFWLSGSKSFLVVFYVHYCSIYRQQHRELVMLLCAETFYSAGVLHISYLKWTALYLVFVGAVNIEEF